MQNTQRTELDIVKKRKRFNKLALKEWIAAYLFLSPILIIFGYFVLYPMFKGIYISFFDYSLRKFDFIGLENYKSLLSDEIFIKSLVNTLVIVLGTVPVVIILSLFISLVIYKKNPFLRSLFRGIFYLPAVSSIVSITVVWGWILHPNYGILNYITGLFGAEPQTWLGNQKYALISIIVVLITLSVGQPIILYIASLGNIPTSYLEAAEIDGATSWQMFRKITWPLLMPTTLYIVIISTINSFQTFAIIQLLTSGGPAYATSTIMYLVYERAFTLNKYGLASAMGVILAVIIMLISIVQYKFFGEEVDY